MLSSDVRASRRLILGLTIANVAGNEFGRLTPQPPSPWVTAGGLFLLLIPLVGAWIAGRRDRPRWLRDAVRDVLVGQVLGWTLGLSLVGLLHGGLSSGAWLAVFAPILIAASALLTLVVAPLARRTLRHPPRTTADVSRAG